MEPEAPLGAAASLLRNPIGRPPGRRETAYLREGRARRSARRSVQSTAGRLGCLEAHTNSQAPPSDGSRVALSALRRIPRMAPANSGGHFGALAAGRGQSDTPNWTPVCRHPHNRRSHWPGRSASPRVEVVPRPAHRTRRSRRSLPPPTAGSPAPRSRIAREDPGASPPTEGALAPADTGLERPAEAAASRSRSTTPCLPPTPCSAAAIASVGTAAVAAIEHAPDDVATQPRWHTGPYLFATGVVPWP
mmetsp:Transcript_39521/g.73683  ORF Transcript_39521/g.73683 Transcript_39521/m.73683 type:complete len:248 (-) Transcript_39521:47-790(-)